jgi:hypothetical protein
LSPSGTSRPDTGHRQPDVARLVVGAHRKRARRRGLGHAQTRDDAQALADGGGTVRVELIPHRLAKRGAGEHERLAAREQRGAQQRVVIHRAGDLLEALGHVEVHGRRDLAQVAQRSAIPAGVGFVVDHSVPPLASVMPMLWLPPKVWFHGSQSTSTGDTSARKRMH